MMKTAVKRLLYVLLALLAASLLGAILYLNSIMPIITGYAAKNLASAVFVSGRDPSEVEALDLNFSPIKYARNRVDFPRGIVTSRFLWSRSVAVYREGYGVTLLRGEKLDSLRSRAYPLPHKEPIPERLLPGDSTLVARLSSITKEFVLERSYGGTPFALVVLHKGGIVAEGYRQGMGPDTRFLSWSMAKSFTNALAGVMSGDSLVDIHTPVDVPQWRGDARSSITLSDLMQMQSGLAWNENYGNRSDVNLMLFSEADMGQYAISKPLEHAPGTFWYYSSGSTNIVMRVLRGKFPSDEEFLKYMRDRLFAPIGIWNACFEPDVSGTPVGSSYLYATARDFARFGQLYLEDGMAEGKRILPEGWVEYTKTPASASGGRYGAFFYLNRGHSLRDVPEDMFACYGHDGQKIYIIPSKELVVVALGYSPQGVDFNRLLRDILSRIT